ncbi:MAG: tRNA (adenosine(37)-N6)-threonylcarbamoyltransferase complex transferase subunit TsaD [Bacteroidetes bacterium]|nr:tRNA (adenosine(37)-N6)-threonylcarbamoyltransferase complex transferase subunit TsaD [Bacteroidota bacterium]MCL6097827.1 tRNA (adenosine(37)-N6)-threonylcarbamoyltransferase complex transferase subunit TsaD [Bacteroidota bacterium]
MNVLGIESSCDETSVAILSDGNLLSNLVSSQDIHNVFGGVVPELSSRAHLQIILPLVKKALQDSKLSLNQIDLVAATAGPGLIGALLVGLTFTKGLAFSLSKPFVAVNHIEGHIFSGFLMNDKPEFPYLCLVVSGGHTLLLLVKSDTEIQKLGSTIDDAAGEAFDKVSKLLGLGYPGGPQIQHAALNHRTDFANFPVAQCKNEFDFSFSGLKTSVLRFIQKEYGDASKIPANNLPLIAAAFQHSAVKALIDKTEKALQNFKVNSISLVGGVAANQLLRDEFQKLSQRYKKKLVIPSLEYCGDNGAMIAYRGLKLHQAGIKYGYDFNAYPSLSDYSFIK